MKQGKLDKKNMTLFYAGLILGACMSFLGNVFASVYLDLFAINLNLKLLLFGVSGGGFFFLIGWISLKIYKLS